MRESVKWFAGIMEQTLQKHDKKKGSDGWLNDNSLSLLDRLKQETAELEDILIVWDSKYSSEIVKECADIANFAMMIADIER